MATVNIHDAKTHLSRLVARVERGETIIIGRAGTPVAQLVPIPDPRSSRSSRIGFLKGQASVPDDFDTWGSEEITVLFEGGE